MRASNVADGDGNVVHTEWGCAECSQAFEACRDRVDAQWDACVAQSGSGYDCSVQLEGAYYACSNDEITCCTPKVKQAQCSSLPATEQQTTEPEKTAAPDTTTQNGCAATGRYWLNGNCYQRLDADAYCQSLYGPNTKATLTDGTAGCACLDGYANPTGNRCEPQDKDRCDDIICDGRCEQPLSSAGKPNDYAVAIPSGTCNRDTQTCEYPDEVKCPAGCKVQQTKQPDGRTFASGVCAEECDDGTDNDGDGAKDCADTDCATSLACSCKNIASKPAPAGSHQLKIVIGAYNQADKPTFVYTSKDRDDEVIEDARRIFEAITTTEPLNQYGFTLSATRYSNADFLWKQTTTSTLWTGDVLARCGGGDITINIDYNTLGTPQARLRSKHVDMYKRAASKEEFGYVVLHELGHAIAGLWDEYDTGKEFGQAFGTINELTGFLSILKSNCAVAGTEQECKDYFNQYKTPYTCVKGCNSPLWYRSSEDSIMRYVDASHQFNTISKTILRQKLDAMTKPQQITLGASYQPNLER